MNRARSRLAIRMVACISMSMFLVSVSGQSAFAIDGELKRRWVLMETPYEEQNIARKIGSNLRDGVVGLVDSLGQGAMSAISLFNPRNGGVLLPKLSTFAGDLVGLIDNNYATRYVTKGIISRHLLRFGAAGHGAAEGIAFLHDAEWDELPEMTLADYVGDTYFHPKTYYTPSIVAGIAGIVVGDFVVRPVGHIIMIFGARKAGESVDEWGKNVVAESLQIPFI